LNFVTSDYPCFNTGSDTASLDGQISGNFVTLQIVGTDGSVLGQIGETVAAGGPTGLGPINFTAARGGYIVHGVGPSYLVATGACQGSSASIYVNGAVATGDFGEPFVGYHRRLPASGCDESVLSDFSWASTEHDFDVADDTDKHFGGDAEQFDVGPGPDPSGKPG